MPRAVLPGSSQAYESMGTSACGSSLWMEPTYGRLIGLPPTLSSRSRTPTDRIGLWSAVRIHSSTAHRLGENQRHQPLAH